MGVFARIGNCDVDAFEAGDEVEGAFGGRRGEGEASVWMSERARGFSDTESVWLGRREGFRGAGDDRQNEARRSIRRGIEDGSDFDGRCGEGVGGRS